MSEMVARCPTCGVQDPLLNEFCSDGFHALGETYWPTGSPDNPQELIERVDSAIYGLRQAPERGEFNRAIYEARQAARAALSGSPTTDPRNAVKLSEVDVGDDALADKLVEYADEIEGLRKRVEELAQVVAKWEREEAEGIDVIEAACALCAALQGQQHSDGDGG
jgi:hypothetical protein